MVMLSACHECLACERYKAVLLSSAAKWSRPVAMHSWNQRTTRPSL